MGRLKIRRYWMWKKYSRNNRRAHAYALISNCLSGNRLRTVSKNHYFFLNSRNFVVRVVCKRWNPWNCFRICLGGTQQIRCKLNQYFHCTDEIRIIIWTVCSEFVSGTLRTYFFERCMKLIIYEMLWVNAKICSYLLLYSVLASKQFVFRTFFPFRQKKLLFAAVNSAQTTKIQNQHCQLVKS